MDDQSLRQNHFNYIGCDLSHENNIDWDNKEAKLRRGPIHRTLKSKTKQKNTSMKFYKTVAIPGRK